MSTLIFVNETSKKPAPRLSRKLSCDWLISVSLKSKLNSYKNSTTIAEVARVELGLFKNGQIVVN